MNKLNHHLRQYRHNNSPDLIHGYEKEGTEAFVSCLEQEISELKAQVDILQRAARQTDNQFRKMYPGKIGKKCVF